MAKASRNSILMDDFFKGLKTRLDKSQILPLELYNVDLRLEPEWYSGNLNGYPGAEGYPPRRDVSSCSQSELLEPVFSDIANSGLHTVYTKYISKNASSPAGKTSNPKTIIIVGGGIAGLTAAYELLRAGHQVRILETQERAGGRVKTFTEKDGFAKDLYADAGAMRLPNKKDEVPKFHYLTDHYITEFGLTSKLKLFKNKDDNDNVFYKFYNNDPIRKKDWDQNPHANTSTMWPGWDAKFKDNPKYKVIKDINDYYEKTLGTIKDQLTQRLASVDTNTAAAAIWSEWVLNWSRFSLVSLMRSSVTTIQHTVDKGYWEGITKGDPPKKVQPLDVDTLNDLLPWPEVAIKAFSVFNYTEQLDQCLVQYLRDELGDWWQDEMHHIEGGMHLLPQKFLNNSLNPLEGHVTYSFTVDQIDYGRDIVSVKGFHSKSGRLLSPVTGNAVIVTVPLHALRQIRFIPSKESDPFPNQFYQAVEDIWYGPSTKIMIQSRTKFWAKTGNKDNDIYGGFTKTNLPIGQVHYPTIVNPNEKGIADSPGILLCYTWKAEALLFGALEPAFAIKKAVSEIAQVHPEIEDEFEAGAIHAWYSDPAAQGAYALLKPQQFQSVQYLMMNPFKNIFFAGEGISHCTGWIQGAMESGLRAAYQFYSKNESSKILLDDKPVKSNFKQMADLVTYVKSQAAGFYNF